MDVNWEAVAALATVALVAVALFGGVAFWMKIGFLWGKFQQTVEDILTRLGIHRKELDEHEKILREHEGEIERIKGRSERD